MNSALKPVLPQPGTPQPGGQASPAKGNVASINHTVGHPQGAQNSLHHVPNNLVGQNLTHHVPAPQLLPHAAPSMAPVSANMAQMAQNMSHHGNLSHVQNSVVQPINAPIPNKSTTSSPLSLVQDKVTPSQPLALTRTPEKKDCDSTQANGTLETVKPASNVFKPQNTEINKDKQDIAKTSPSTPKPPEKVGSTLNSPPKHDINPVNQTDGPSQPKVATANEPPEKSPSKPVETKPTPTADVAPTQSDCKPVPESANDTQEKPVVKLEFNEPQPANEPPKQFEEKKEESFVDKPAVSVSSMPSDSKKEDNDVKDVQKDDINLEKSEEKKSEPKLSTKTEPKVVPKSTLKLATVTPIRKRRQTSPSKTADGSTPGKKSTEGEITPDARSKRNRTKVQLYQSPTPELTMVTKLSASAGRSTPPKQNEDKLIVFYKNEYLAVRNAEGGFYVCQAMQNVYRTTRKIKIRWLSQDKTLDPTGETYKPDFYDVTDMECVLTTLSLSRASSGGGAQLLSEAERSRALSILQRALHAERGAPVQLTEEHPDGLDLSLYTDESQLEKKSRKRNSSKSSPQLKDDEDKDSSPSKKARTTPKRNSKIANKAKTTPTQPPTNKRKSPGSTPNMATTSKTATAVTEKVKAKSTPKRTPVKQNKPATPATLPTRKGRRATRDNKSSPVATPSTSTGTTTRKSHGKK